MFFRFLPRVLLASLSIITPLFAFADCSEVPMNYAQLIAIAESSSTTDLNSFLQALPPHSMTNVTLVYNSRGTEEEKKFITKDLPGVIRSTADGKLIFRYECAPDSPFRNQIKVLRLEETNGHSEFKTSMIQLSKDSLTTNHVSENPASCKTCHQNLNANLPMLKPVWNSYKNWPGLYGSHDDNLKLGGEQVDFQNFINNHQTDPCYQASLPASLYTGQIPSPESSSRDPEALYQFNANNQFRPNLKFSTNFSLLYAKALASELLDSLQKSAQLEAALPELLSGIFSCERSLLTNRIDKLDAWESQNPFAGPNKNFYALLTRLGMTQSDFNLALNGQSIILGFTPSFTPAVYAEKDGPIWELNFLALLRAQLAEQLKKQIPEIDQQYTLSRGTEAYYSQTNNSCTDDLGGRMVFTGNHRQELCKTLALRFPKNSSANVSPTFAVLVAKPITQTDFTRFDGLPPLKILMKTCKGCHSQEANEKLNFFKSEEAFVKKISDTPEFAQTVAERLQSVDDPMPPFKMKAGPTTLYPVSDWPSLEKNDREDVLAFLKQFSMTTKIPNPPTEIPNPHSVQP
jgi:hypothetical protein